MSICSKEQNTNVCYMWVNVPKIKWGMSSDEAIHQGGLSNGIPLLFPA
jgi:hypothetical protein